MSTNYTKEQLQKMKSSALINIILELQQERAEQDNFNEQSIRHLNLSYKEQVEAQKEMITDLLNSEEILKQQLQQITEQYNKLKAQRNQKIDQVEVKSSARSKSNNMKITFGDNSQQLKLFIQGSDLQNSCIIEEEEVKIDDEGQLSSYNNSAQVKDTPSKRIGNELKSGQYLTFSTQQNLLQSKAVKNSNNHSGNHLFKSIQSSNYIINPPENFAENNGLNSIVEYPEPIQKFNSQKNYLETPTPSRILIDSRTNIPQGGTFRQNTKSNLSIVVTEPKENENNLHPSQGVSCTNQIQQNEQTYNAGGGLKISKNIPRIEKKSNTNSILVSQQLDLHNNNNNNNQGLYASNILQSQLLFVSNQQPISPVNSNNVSLKIGDLLYEDFFIIGPSISELTNVVQNSPDLVNGTVQPDIYVSFPGQQNTNDQDQRQSLKNFCYPFDVPFQKHIVKNIHQGKVDDILNLQIFKANISKNSPNSFVFSMLGEVERSNDKSILNPVLLNANPHLSLYCICYTTENFVTIPSVEGGSKDEENAVYLAPLTYCFMTYYPFISHFLDIISEIANYSKLIRAAQYMNLFSQDDQIKTKCLYCQNNTDCGKKEKSQHLSPVLERISEQSSRDSHTTKNSTDSVLQRGSNTSNGGQQYCNCAKKNILSKILELDIENEVKTFLSESFSGIRKGLVKSQTVVPEYQRDLVFKGRIDKSFAFKNYMVPAINRLVQIETEWGACLTMSCLALEDFLFIMTAVCLENKIVFFSANIALLTSAILTFYSIFKPFIYVLPVIYNTPFKLLGMLEAPVPLILGINKDISYQQSLEESGTDFSDKVIIDLDASKIICQSSKTKDYIEKHIPMFKNQQQEMVEKYFMLNSRQSNQFKIFNSIRKKRSSYQPSTQNSHQQVQDNLLYQVTDEQYNAMINFIEIIRRCADEYFLKHLPQKTEELSNNLDLNFIQNSILANSKNDYEFIKEFMKTQSFTAYLESVYLTPQQ